MNPDKTIPRSRNLAVRLNGGPNRDWSSAMAHTIRLPASLHKHTDCGDPQPRGWYRCNRPAGHTGRHHFAHRHTTGLLRGVWA